MMLPKGFVKSADEVYAEVAAHSAIPPSELCKYWKGAAVRLYSHDRPKLISAVAYTVTKGTLGDPTAHRLGNFWWHVWGSDRKRLSGRTLAGLYREISTGSTVVPWEKFGQTIRGTSSSLPSLIA